jgi:hypothetical protein
MRIVRPTVMAAALSVLFPALDGAATYGQATAPPIRRHALLIGISKYVVKSLEGPQYDVRTLAAVLRDQYKFDSVEIVQDAQATKQGILQAIDALQTRTAPGDFVLVYYSGHGTSALDRRLRMPGLSSNTGALLPSDFTRSGTDKELLGKVIIGNRDLRPRFERLEATRDVVVIFDSCYSANTARSMGMDDGSTSRAMPWDALVDVPSSRSGGEALFPDDDQPSPWGEKTSTLEPYPYKRTIYLAASGVGEEAQDIPARRLPRYPTLDGLPHGAFTNALLKGLAGYANTNGDDTLTYRELFEFTRAEVTRQFPHTPQVSAPVGGDNLLDRPVFARKGVARPVSTAAAAGPLRILLKPGAGPELTAALSGIARTSLVPAGAHDLRIEPRPGGALVLHGSGDRLFEFEGAPALVAQQVAARVRRQAGVHPLLNMTFPSQMFNIGMQLPILRGYLLVGERQMLRIDSELHAFLVILNIDAEGKVFVLYPRSGEELKHTTAGLNLEIYADPNYPTGTEFIKVFAFEQRPPGIEGFSGGQELEGDSPRLGSLISILQSAPGRHAQAILKIVTAKAN